MVLGKVWERRWTVRRCSGGIISRVITEILDCVLLTLEGASRQREAWDLLLKLCD